MKPAENTFATYENLPEQHKMKALRLWFESKDNPSTSFRDCLFELSADGLTGKMKSASASK